MPPLYDDTGPPLLLCGYASVFNVTYSNGDQLERVAPGAFQFPGNVRLDFDHHGRCLASTYGGSLKLWQDARAGVRGRPAPEWNTVSLMRGVRRGTFRAASFMNIGDGKCVFEWSRRTSRLVNVIKRISVDEICVATSGANPAACCWLGDEAADEVPAGSQKREHDGRSVGKDDTSPRIGPRPGPRLSRQHAVMAIVDRCLAWLRGAR